MTVRLRLVFNYAWLSVLCSVGLGVQHASARYEQSAIIRLRLNAETASVLSESRLRRLGFVTRGTEIEIAVDPDLVPERDPITAAELRRMIDRLENRRWIRVKRRDGTFYRYPVHPIRLLEPSDGSSESVEDVDAAYMALGRPARLGRLEIMQVVRPPRGPNQKQRVVEYEGGEVKEVAPTTAEGPLPDDAAFPSRPPVAPPVLLPDSHGARSSARPDLPQQFRRLIPDVYPTLEAAAEAGCRAVGKTLNPRALRTLATASEATQVQVMEQAIERYSNSPRARALMRSAYNRAGDYTQRACYAFVKEAMIAAGYAPSPRWTDNSAKNAGPHLRRLGFVNILGLQTSRGVIDSPMRAPKGAVLVYDRPGNRRAHGHIEVKTADGCYASDYRSCRPPGVGYRLIGVYIKTENL